ncbi:hypothetical protein, partial [Frankia nepalensis]|uniref:hypothetical protein n=1 Tax=Frankia nepalensis TaxID=1836974 RepID=UPI001EE3FC8E
CDVDDEAVVGAAGAASDGSERAKAGATTDAGPAADEPRANRAAPASSAATGARSPESPALTGNSPAFGKKTTAQTTPDAGPALQSEDDSGPGTSDRRQFHRIAGVVVGALLIEGQIMEVSGMLAASPVQLALDRAERVLFQALGAHEVIPPTQILAQTARLHRGLERLARRRMADSQWKRLRVLAGRVAVLRADAAFKQGDVAAARVLTAQGYTAGLAAGDGALCGSAREVGAVTEFYDGRPDEALRLARDGQRHVTAGPVRARLVCQEARALAGLGDVQGAARALDHAYDLADEIPPDRWGRPGPSFDEFHPVEVSYNATTALCLLGRPRAAEEHAELALPKLDGMDAPGFRSVIRLDLALALARAGRLELERACSLAGEAINISWGRTVASVSGRADQLLAATRPHGEVPEVRELAALVREWQRSAAQQGSGDGSPEAAAAAVRAGRLDGDAPRTPPGLTLPGASD